MYNWCSKSIDQWLRRVLFQFIFFYKSVHVLCKKWKLKGKIEIERELQNLLVGFYLEYKKKILTFLYFFHFFF